jgi:hypothetical protein
MNTKRIRFNISYKKIDNGYDFSVSASLLENDDVLYTEDGTSIHGNDMISMYNRCIDKVPDKKTKEEFSRSYYEDCINDISNTILSTMHTVDKGYLEFIMVLSMNREIGVSIHNISAKISSYINDDELSTVLISTRKHTTDYMFMAYIAVKDISGIDKEELLKLYPKELLDIQMNISKNIVNMINGTKARKVITDLKAIKLKNLIKSLL